MLFVTLSLFAQRPNANMLMFKDFISKSKLLRNHLKYGQILFCTTSERHETHPDTFNINLVRFRELSSQKGSSYDFTKPIKSAKQMLKDLQRLELRLDTELQLENMNRNQIDGLLLQAAENEDRDAIIYILKETGKSFIEQPSRYCLEKILIQYVKDTGVLKVCRKSFQEDWMLPYFAANTWHKGDLKLAAQQFRELFYNCDIKQKQIILFLLREITQETVGFKSEASLVILASLAEYFACMFDDYRLLTNIWTTAFKSAWFSDHCLAEDLYKKHPNLRHILSQADTVSSYFQTLLLKDDIETCQRLIQLYLEFGEKESSRLCLCLLFDHHFLESNLKACSEIMKFCVDSNIILTEDHEGRLLDLLLGTKTRKVYKAPKQHKSTPKFRFKF